MRKYVLIILLVLVLNFISMASVSALSILVHVPEKYTTVQSGERFYFEIEIKYPENPSRRDLILNYEILKDDEVISRSKVLKAVETQASFIDFIVIPENAGTGLHVIRISISDYEDLSEEVEASFHVVRSDSDKIKLYFFVLLGVIVLVGILVIVVILRGRK